MAKLLAGSTVGGFKISTEDDLKKYVTVDKGNLQAPKIEGYTESVVIEKVSGDISLVLEDIVSVYKANVHSNSTITVNIPKNLGNNVSTVKTLIVNNPTKSKIVLKFNSKVEWLNTEPDLSPLDEGKAVIINLLTITERDTSGAVTTTYGSYVGGTV